MGCRHECLAFTALTTGRAINFQFHKRKPATWHLLRGQHGPISRFKMTASDQAWKPNHAQKQGPQT
jgi:hypothetical protein